MTLRKRTLALLIAAALTPQFAATAYAQAPGYAPPPAQASAHVFVQAELDQMLAPIALYPDPLLSQVLMAATYPIEVVEAARWTRANPGLRGDAAVRAVQYQDWDPSVKSLCAFPQILQRMDEHLQWTESLGDAFLAQEADVMDSVQQLRHSAYASGHLRSTAQIRVVEEGPYFYVRLVRPELVYVPYYDPLVVYGDWRWPAYRPFAWAPWPGYVRPSGVSVGFWFGSPVTLSANFFFGDFDWGRRSVRVVRPTAYYYRQPTVVVQNSFINRSVDRNTWQHDPHHRRGAEYRQAEVRQRFASAQTERRQLERRPDQREAQAPVSRQAQAPRQQLQAQPQARPEQTRPERREAREERQRSDAQPVERAQRQQAAERVQRQQQDQQREQSRAAERAQRDQQRQQAETARSQQRQQAEAARAQQQQARQQQRQQAEGARAQQQQQRQQAQAAEQGQRQQRQQAREERKGQREERKEQHAGNKD